MPLIDLFSSIANAIREKKGTTELINATDFPDEIRSIKGGTDTEHTELSYIETSGTQYIDTGVGENAENITIKTKATFITRYKSQDAFLWSSFNGASTGLGDLYADSSYNKFAYYYNSSSEKFGYCEYYPLSEYEIESHQTLDKIDTIVNGTSYTTNRTATPINNNITLFRRGNADTYKFYGKLYYMQIYINDVLVRDYIPVKDTSGIICLYDKVTNSYFYNNGSGAFIGGFCIE